jgi:hypothetical protein
LNPSQTGPIQSTSGKGKFGLIFIGVIAVIVIATLIATRK